MHPPIQLIKSPVARRSSQMNLGAQRASGTYLCFLHADTLLPTDALRVIDQTLARPKLAAGGFISLMRGPLRIRWITSFHNYIKTYYAPLFFRPHLFFFKGARLLFGDQGIFCRRWQFLDCGGYAEDLPIMEEADLLLRLVRYGRIRQVNRRGRIIGPAGGSSGVSGGPMRCFSTLVSCGGWAIRPRS